jgi:hypothetical protein
MQSTELVIGLMNSEIHLILLPTQENLVLKIWAILDPHILNFRHEDQLLLLVQLSLNLQ